MQINHWIMPEPDFMIKGLMKFQLFGQELWITTTTIGVSIVTLALIVFAVMAGRTMKRGREVPEGFQNILECMIEALEGFTGQAMGKYGGQFFNYIGTLFLFILCCNIAGLVGIRTPTSDFGVTILLGIVTFLIVQYQGIRHHKFGHFTRLFKPFPILFPINLIGEIANPLSLSLRLFGNMVSGVIIMGLWYGMMPIWASIGVPAVLHGYFDLFSGGIQTYVFCMLTMVYINEKIE